MNPAGTFWCNECAMEVSDTIREAHIRSHRDFREAAIDDQALDQATIFWLFCVAVGGIGAAIVTILSPVI